MFLADVLQEPTVLAPGDYGAAFGKMLLTLTLLVTLLILTYWLIRKVCQQRMQKGRETQAIQILERRMISPKTTLYLVEVEKKTRVLIAESHLEIKKIENIPQRDSI